GAFHEGADDLGQERIADDAIAGGGGETRPEPKRERGGAEDEDARRERVESGLEALVEGYSAVAEFRSEPGAQTGSQTNQHDEGQARRQPAGKPAQAPHRLDQEVVQPATRLLVAQRCDLARS